MAEPNAAPVGARVNSSGGVDTGGRKAWIWVQDETTGHRFDVRAAALPTPDVTVVVDYPINYRADSRPGKTRAQWETDPAEPPVAAPAKSSKGGAA